MKKSLSLLFAALMALTIIVPAQANDVLTICEGTQTSHYVPFSNGDYQASNMHSQLIYPAELLADMNGQQINVVTFYMNGTLHADGGLLVVKMGETEKTVYASTQDFCTGLVQVTSTPLTQGVSEVIIELSSPYVYNGGNLVMDFTVAEPGDENFYAWDYFYGVQQPSGNYTAIGSDGMLNNFLPKATFDYGTPQEWDASVAPEAISFNLPAEREQVQVITVKNKGLNAFTPVITADVAAPLSAEFQAVELASGQSLDIPVKFAPVEAGEYSGSITIDCGEAGNFVVNIAAVSTAPLYEVVACAGEDNNMYLPFYGYYYDTAGTMGQMIYTEEMMGATKGNKITKVTFYPSSALGFTGGKVQLSFKVVDQTEFTEATPIDEMQAVATVAPAVGATELVFVLDQPFVYEGGNLAIEATVIESANYKNTLFVGQNFDYNPSMYKYENYSGSIVSGMTTFLPKAMFSYEVNDAPEVMRGDVNGDNQVNISDVTALIGMLLNDIEAPASADCNLDNVVTIGDVTALISYLLSEQW